MRSLASLSDSTLTIIFATSPTGLGHLRVTDALYHGLPNTASPVLLGAQDPLVSTVYRFISIHPFTRLIMEIFQKPPFDRPFAFVSRIIIRSQTKLLYQQLQTILQERFVVPKTVLLIASHINLGHQLGTIKKKLEKDFGMTVLLVVQVTDDAPQPLWYVYDADCIFVPTYYTKDHLLSYAKSAHLPMVPIVVAPYPISPRLTKKISPARLLERIQQTDPDSKSNISMTIPVPGAAVGTSFMSEYMQELHVLSRRFVFHVISREAPFTNSFLKVVSNYDYAKLYTSKNDKTTVDNYERVLQEVPIALELTKPSEQAFKALFTPKQQGGVIMLFSEPIGEQEYDNLRFLRSNKLMPTDAENHMLWENAKDQNQILPSLKELSSHWRALQLPENPVQAANFTIWCLNEGLFSTMMHYSPAKKGKALQSNGVEQFWQNIVTLLHKSLGKDLSFSV